MRTFIENVKVLALENCLLMQMPNVLTLNDIHNLQIKQIESLAAESEDVSICRQNTQQDHKHLENALRTCKEHRTGHRKGMLVNPCDLSSVAHFGKPYHGHCLAYLHVTRPHRLAQRAGASRPMRRLYLVSR